MPKRLRKRLNKLKVNDKDVYHEDIDKDQLTPQTLPGLAGHQWIQRGPYLVCQSCPTEHAVFIGTEVMFAGCDEEGLPILKKIELREKI